MSVNEDLRHFWWRAEEPEPIFAADDVNRWPAGRLDRLCRLGLLRETEPASTVMCYNCPRPHGAGVLFLNEDLLGRTRPHILCPDEGLVEVDLDGMRQWLLDRQALARTLAAALEAAGHVEEIVPNRVWALGRRHLAGRFRDFFFVAGAARADGLAVIASAGRIGTVASPVILIPSKPPRPEQWKNSAVPLFCLSDVAVLGEDRLTLDLDYIEDALPRDRAAAGSKSVRSIAVPEGATWNDLTITLGDIALVTVVGGVRTESSLEECGFTRGHSDGDMTLQVLRLLAHHRGTFSKRDIPRTGEEKTPLKKQISVLRGKLKALLPIEGEPILYDKVSGGYRCVFQLSLDSDPGFPAAESWLDFRIESSGGGRIRVSVNAKEVFRAASQTREEGAAPEAAVRESRVWREYSLERLGFANTDGTPTAEGITLLAFLRGGGRLERRPDDMALLRLGQRLRQLSGIQDEPFRYSDRKGIWIASFDCGSAGRP